MTLQYELARRATELLSDGQWHSYEDVRQDLMRLVPPGRALRETERIRRRQQLTRHGVAAERIVDRSVEFQIISGARSIVRTFLKTKTVFEVYPAGRGGAGRDPVAYNRSRKIRMIGEHRQLKTTARPRQSIYVRLTAATERVETLRDLLAEARAVLAAHGLQHEAARLVEPGASDDGEGMDSAKGGADESE